MLFLCYIYSVAQLLQVLKNGFGVCFSLLLRTLEGAII